MELQFRPPSLFPFLNMEQLGTLNPPGMPINRNMNKQLVKANAQKFFFDISGHIIDSWRGKKCIFSLVNERTEWKNFNLKQSF